MQETQQPSLRRPAYLQIPELPSPSCPFPWSSPCSIIHGFPDSPLLPSPAALPREFCAATRNHPTFACPHPTSDSACGVSDHSCMNEVISSNPQQPSMQPYVSSTSCQLVGSESAASPAMVSEVSMPATLASPTSMPLEARCDREGRRSVIQIGTFVFVKCNQSKWLFGQVKRWADAGVVVWVNSVQVMVNVPFSLLPTHMAPFSNSSPIQQAQGLHGSSSDDSSAVAASMQGKIHLPPFLHSASCPSSLGRNMRRMSFPLLASCYGDANPKPHSSPPNPSSTSITLSGLQHACWIVRPAHLSHRQLYRHTVQKHANFLTCKDHNYSHPSIDTDHSPQLGHDIGQLSHIVSTTLHKSSIDAKLLSKDPVFLNASPSSQKSKPTVDVDTKSILMEPLFSSNHLCSPSSSKHRQSRAEKLIEDARRRMDKATLMRSASLPPTRPREPRCHGAVRTRELYPHVVRTAADVRKSGISPALSKSRRHAASSDGLEPSRHEEQIASKQGTSIKDDPLQNRSARRCKSLGLAEKQVWHTVIKNGLHTKSKKSPS